MSRSPYDDFASFYDCHWSRHVAKDFNHALKLLLFPSLTGGSHILDVCCGTGRAAGYLLKQGYSVTGIDASSAMIERARRRAPAARFIHAYVEDAAPLPRLDAAVCLFDSLNHFLTLPKLRRALKFIHRSLVPGGTFIFDLNTEAAFHHRWLEHYTVIEDDMVVAVEGDFNPVTRFARYDFAAFHRHGDSWRRSDFTIRERCYSLTTIRRELAHHNFKPHHELDAEGELNLQGHTGRTFFVVSTL